MGATATRITAEQYFSLSEEGDHKQLVDGEIVVNNPKPIHGHVQLTLLVSLRTWADSAAGRGLVLPPTDVVLDEYNVFGPDVVWVADHNRPEDMRELLQRVPDLCAEIRSPGTWRYDIGAKKAAYEAGGLPELWLVDDVAEVLLVFRRSAPEMERFDVALELGPEDALESPQLPGFTLPIADVFRR